MKNFKSIVPKETKILDTINKMSSSKENNYIAGFSVIVDDKNRVIGVLTDGDIRRGLSNGASVEDSVEKIANFNPITVVYSEVLSEMRDSLTLIEKNHSIDLERLEYVVLVDKDGRFLDVVRSSSILDINLNNKTIAVYGMGFVGLTLAATFANENMSVVGIDTDQTVIDNLKKGIPSFFENGLESLLSLLIKNNKISFTSDGHIGADIHIVSVGTPIDENNKPSNKFIIEVTNTIAKKLKTNDLVVFRSTIPVGTMRGIVIPILEECGLKAGHDFFVSFAPERTVEGNALEELRVLPQIVGGIDEKSTNITSQLFSMFASTIVETESLEAAEMIKLLNNTFRDVVFSFSNEVAMICDGLNINAFKLIELANEGYPRNKIPSPSPGVGGLCLSKDPYLYTNPCANIQYQPILGKASRMINTGGPSYVLNKIKDFCNKIDLDIDQANILLIGLAFKGSPETSDIRDSMAMQLVELLPNRSNIHIKDYVVSKAVINEIGCNYVENVIDGFDGADIVLIMNNHPSNKRFNVYNALNNTNKPTMFFDGWNMFNQSEIENIDNIYYSTMGYMSNK